MPYPFARGRSFHLRTAGRVTELFSIRGTTTPIVSSAVRGRITSWSQRSRNRLSKTLEAIDWSSLGEMIFVALTYPNDTKGEFTAQKAKRDLAALFMRWRRRWGNPVGAWKMEYQRRGVPHFHLLVKAPAPLGEMREWLRKVWFEVVGSGVSKHYVAGTSCDIWHDKEPSYFAWYARKGTKGYQNTAPDGQVPGRWWGLWGLKPEWTSSTISLRQFVRLRRYLVALRRSRAKGYRVRKPHGLNGLWTYGDFSVEKLLKVCT